MTQTATTPYTSPADDGGARRLDACAQAALLAKPVVLLQGPHHSGKSALARRLGGEGGAQRRMLDLNDPAALAAARQDPLGLMLGLDAAARPLTITELQRAPQLLCAIAQSVQANPSAGRFLLTSSGDLTGLVAMTPGLPNALQLMHVLPPSQTWLTGAGANWLDAAFAGLLPALASAQPLTGSALQERSIRGSMAQAVTRDVARSRHLWVRRLLLDLLAPGGPDLQDLHQRHRLLGLPKVEKTGKLPALLDGVAAACGQLANFKALGERVGLNSKTTDRYVAALEQLLLVERIPAFGKGRLPRAVATPRLQFLDAGVLADCLGQNGVVAGRQRGKLGAAWSADMARVLLCFVTAELKKHAEVAQGSYRISHYRDHDQREVDLVIENADREVIAVHVTAGATVTPADFRVLANLGAQVGDDFKAGVLLYDGMTTERIKDLPGGAALWKVPVSSLWGDVTT